MFFALLYNTHIVSINYGKEFSFISKPLQWQCSTNWYESSGFMYTQLLWVSYLLKHRVEIICKDGRNTFIQGRNQSSQDVSSGPFLKCFVIHINSRLQRYSANLQENLTVRFFSGSCYAENKTPVNFKKNEIQMKKSQNEFQWTLI